MQKRNPILWRDFSQIKATLGIPVKFDTFYLTCPKCGSVDFYVAVREINHRNVLGSIQIDSSFVDIWDEGENHHFEQEITTGFTCENCDADYTQQELEEINAKH